MIRSVCASPRLCMLNDVYVMTALFSALGWVQSSKCHKSVLSFTCIHSFTFPNWHNNVPISEFPIINLNRNPFHFSCELIMVHYKSARTWLNGITVIPLHPSASPAPSLVTIIRPCSANLWGAPNFLRVAAFAQAKTNGLCEMQST